MLASNVIVSRNYFCRSVFESFLYLIFSYNKTWDIAKSLACGVYGVLKQQKNSNQIYTNVCTSNFVYRFKIHNIDELITDELSCGSVKVFENIRNETNSDVIAETLTAYQWIDSPINDKEFHPLIISLINMYTVSILSVMI